MFSGFAGSELLMDGERVAGVRTGDRGIGRHGAQRANFEPGVDIRAKVTILADGVRGNLTKQLTRRSRIAVGRQPQLFALGIKELWDVPAGRLPAGTVMHTLGYPLEQAEFGGGFIYAMSDTRLSVGFVVGLDYKNPMFDPHVAFQRLKVHPLISSLLRGGQMMRYGAKALPGGRMAHAAPVRSRRRDHRRRCSGILEFHAPQRYSSGDENGDARCRNRFRRRSGRRHVEAGCWPSREDSPELGRAELRPVRHVHQAFKYGLFGGLAFAGLQILPGAGGYGRLFRARRDILHLRKLDEPRDQHPRPSSNPIAS
jgi:electron-transferring-flavoprotein dehydrogenase